MYISLKFTSYIIQLPIHRNFLLSTKPMLFLVTVYLIFSALTLIRIQELLIEYGMFVRMALLTLVLGHSL